MKAVWNSAVIAQSDATVVTEGNHYFPPDSVRRDYLTNSSTHTACHWKGLASYYTIEVEGKCNVDAAWCYPDPSPEARQIAGYIAFWKGVDIVK